MNAIDSPLVSVIIPCYRQAQYLKEAVDSALAQTYPAIEIIVVNDGSDDDTESVARSYGPRIQYIHRANGGPSAARNTGIAQARGTYLKFFDADDSLHPEQIAWQAAALAGRTDRISLTAVRFYRDGVPDQFEDHVPDAGSMLAYMFDDLNWLPPAGFLIPAAHVRAVGGFNESLKYHEDWECFGRIGTQLEPELIADRRVGAYYRLRPGSLSANRVAMIRSRAGLLMKLHDRVRSAAPANSNWFGLDLLRAEQGTYQGLVALGLHEPDLLQGLLDRIKELQKRVGFGQYGWRFRFLARLFGYAWAERIRTGIVRLLKIRPPESLDTAAWREKDSAASRNLDPARVP